MALLGEEVAPKPEDGLHLSAPSCLEEVFSDTRNRTSGDTLMNLVGVMRNTPEWA